MTHHHGIWTPWTKTGFQGRSPDSSRASVSSCADGAPDRALLDAYWQGYANPATAKIEAR